MTTDQRAHAWAVCTNCWLPIELILCATIEAAGRVRAGAVEDHWRVSPACEGFMVDGYVEPHTTPEAYLALRAGLTALEHPYRKAPARLI